MRNFLSKIRVIFLLAATIACAWADDRLVGIWVLDEGFQTTELLLRSDGRYQLDSRSNDPELDFSSSERGSFEANGNELALTPYDFIGSPERREFGFRIDGSNLTLTRVDLDITQVYQFKPGSREEVLAKQSVSRVPVGMWRRTIPFAGQEEYTFRPGGYYVRKNSSEGDQFPPEFVRGRYQLNGTALTLLPYGGTAAERELDFFGNVLTVIDHDESSGHSYSYEAVAGSDVAVQTKAAEAESFLASANWQVGTWEIRDGTTSIDITLRPDGHYIARELTDGLAGIVRGRYTLESRRLHLLPYSGQSIYARSNGEFGKVERTRQLDYYDGELQFIDIESFFQSVTIARKRPGSQAEVLDKVAQSQAQRAKEGWPVGIWEVNDPTGWMEFTFRPDGRYIAKAGTGGIASQAERGDYIVRTDKLTLAPFSGAARGFELDLYDGDLFLAGDLNRLVVARKVPASETAVIQKTAEPSSLKGERGGLLGRWSGYSSELVFRPDGQFRLNQCSGSVLSQDYGLYGLDLPGRKMIYDSRFIPVQSLGLDFYDDTVTLFGGLTAPVTYKVNLGTVDADIANSLAADAAEAAVDAQWLARIPIGARDPNSVQVPTGDIPADPQPTKIFPSPTVFTGYQLYRRLIPGFVYFNELGTIKSVAIVNTREWHFFPTGRVMVRFKNYRAALFYPNTVADVTTFWGAYDVGPNPSANDILHIYAENTVSIETDSGEQEEMTLEDGRRHLFWGKDYMIQSEWATEQKNIPCVTAPNADSSLVNTGVALASTIVPDSVEEPATRLDITRSPDGTVTIRGTNAVAGTLIIESATRFASESGWQPLQTNAAPVGPFSFSVSKSTSNTQFYRVVKR